MDTVYKEQMIAEKCYRINQTISQYLYKTEALTAVVAFGGDLSENFDILAPIIVDSPVIRNVLIAPNGIVTNVYPLEGNEAVIGLDFFSEGEGNIEAIMAKETEQLVLGGPFNLIQGGQALVGRAPVFTEGRNFWGIVSVTLNFPDILHNAELDSIEANGLAYEIWRHNPDTNEKQTIKKSSSDVVIQNARFYSILQIDVGNVTWFMTVASTDRWFQNTEHIILIAVGFLINLSFFLMLRYNAALKKMKTAWETLAVTDSLTGIFNRRHFMEIAKTDIERAQRLDIENYIIIFDIDKFKSVNDTYGHIVGDKLLAKIASRIKSAIRPYDFFARYGGEEFIIYASGTDFAGIYEMTERLRTCINEKCFLIGNAEINSSASFGVALIIDGDLDKAIQTADDRLYKAKNEGRNKIEFE